MLKFGSFSSDDFCVWRPRFFLPTHIQCGPCVFFFLGGGHDDLKESVNEVQKNNRI